MHNQCFFAVLGAISLGLLVLAASEARAHPPRGFPGGVTSPPQTSFFAPAVPTFRSPAFVAPARTSFFAPTAPVFVPPTLAVPARPSFAPAAPPFVVPARSSFAPVVRFRPF